MRYRSFMHYAALFEVHASPWFLFLSLEGGIFQV